MRGNLTGKSLTFYQFNTKLNDLKNYLFEKIFKKFNVIENFVEHGCHIDEKVTSLARHSAKGLSKTFHKSVFPMVTSEVHEAIGVEAWQTV